MPKKGIHPQWYPEAKCHLQRRGGHDGGIHQARAQG
jgi:hypothetical protein